MIDSYHLRDHKWLNDMYKLRRKWATAFSNKLFSAGLLDTSISENANKVLKHAGSKNSFLYEFVMNYEKILNQWRTEEKVEDTCCRHGKPSEILKDHPLLNHAASMYTLAIYGLFEIELVNYLNCKFDDYPITSGNGGASPQFQVRVKSHGGSSRIRHVLMNTQTNETSCSCHKFETMGILCEHVLMVFNFMDVTVIPEAYLLKRWMKCARLRVCNEFQVIDGSCGSDEESDIVFENKAMRMAYHLVHISKPYLEARNMLTTMLDAARDQIVDLIQNLDLENSSMHDDVENEYNEQSVLIRNPLTAKSRGLMNACITHQWDKKNEKGKGISKVHVGASSEKRSERKFQSTQDTQSGKGSKRKFQSTTQSQNSQTSDSVPRTQVPNMRPPQVPNVQLPQFLTYRYPNSRMCRLINFHFKLHNSHLNPGQVKHLGNIQLKGEAMEIYI